MKPAETLIFRSRYTSSDRCGMYNGFSRHPNSERQSLGKLSGA